jgi:hypothetical protein
MNSSRFLVVFFVFLATTFTNFAHAETIGMQCDFTVRPISDPSSRIRSTTVYFKFERNFFSPKFYERGPSDGEWKPINRWKNKKGVKVTEKDDSIKTEFQNYTSGNRTYSGEFLYDFQLRKITGQLQHFNPDGEFQLFYTDCSKFEDVF